MVRRNVELSETARFGSLTECQQRYGFGQAKVREIAKAAGAVCHVGRAARYNFARIDAYLDSLCDEQSDTP